jgi:ribosomal protein L16 Arg81 hydroxylase
VKTWFPKFAFSNSNLYCYSVDANKFPLFDATPGWEVSLQPGEMLFMPARTWHYVRATAGPSLSVSYWWGR